MKNVWKVLPVCWALVALAGAADAAPVVVTPGTLAGYSFYPPGVGGGGSGTGMQETLQTCFVEPSRNDRTIALSLRNWYTQTKPITVYYKMVGGGAASVLGVGGAGVPQQFNAAGGSSVVLKNGVVVAAANGMNGAAAPGGVAGSRVAPTAVTGSFQLSNADTIRLVIGGGAGAGLYVYQYSSTWDYYGVTGGGGSGYYGGGAGSYAYSPGATIANTGAVTTGGTGTAGGSGAANGASALGATNGTSIFNGRGASGTSNGANGAELYIWDGAVMKSYTAGGGGGYGLDGFLAEYRNGGYSCAASPQRAAGRPTKPTSFLLDPEAGSGGFYYQSLTGGVYSECYAGGGGGQVVFQYQAPTCDLIPNWNEP